MSLFIDSHIHFYPEYDPALSVGKFRARTAAAGARTGVMMLCDREGQDSFSMLAGGAGGHVLKEEKTALVLDGENGSPDVVVIAGRQIACKERIEILALGTQAKFADGIRAEEAIRAALDENAIPVLAWGVGKWLGERAKIVDSLLRRFSPDELMLGDTSLRPVFWPEPVAMSRSETLGRRILHGSDPLPPKREQTRAGQLGDVADEPFDESGPLLRGILTIIRNGALKKHGHHAGPFQFAIRQFLKK